MMSALCLHAMLRALCPGKEVVGFLEAGSISEILFVLLKELALCNSDEWRHEALTLAQAQARKTMQDAKPLSLRLVTQVLCPGVEVAGFLEAGHIPGTRR